MNPTDLYSSRKGAPLFPTMPLTAQVGGLIHHESLGSWLHRFREKNGFSSIKSIFVDDEGFRGRSSISDNTMSFPEHVATIAYAAWMSLPTVQRLMLTGKLMGLMGRLSRYPGQWVLYPRPGSRPNSAMRHVVCPLCVVDAPDAFWMQSWRLTLTTQCHVHKVLLLENCPACHSPFVIHNTRDCPLDRCESCLLLFSKMPVEVCDVTFSAPDFVADAGHNDVRNLPVFQVEEHQWWNGVCKILTLIEDPKRSRELACSTLPAEFVEFLSDIGSCPRQAFDRWPIRRRHQGLRFIAWVTEHWPERFFGLLTTLNHSRRSFSFMQANGAPWTDMAVTEFAKRVKRRFIPRVSPEFDLLSRRVAHAYTVTVPCRRMALRPGASPTPSSRWSLDHTARIVQMYDARIWAMRGRWKTKTKFLLNAVSIIQERGALALSAVDRDVIVDLPAIQARQTVDAWRTCLHGLLSQVGSSLDLDPKEVPLAGPSPRLISKWLTSVPSPKQRVLFRWVDQGSPSQHTVSSSSTNLALGRPSTILAVL